MKKPGYTSRGKAFTDLVLLVFRVNGDLIQWGDKMTQPLGLTSARWQVMGVLDDGPATVSAIARRMGLQRQSVQRTADLLEQDGLVTYTENPDHKTARLVMFTNEGRDLYSKISSIYISTANDLSRKLTGEQWNQAIQTLQILMDLLEQENISS
jgi:DNA-binding MarR family transcriptional regulator